MLSLSDPKTSNPVLASLQISTADQLIAVKENGNIDSNFIITHLIKQILHEKHHLVLVGLHNTLDHYQSVGKKLGYDLKRSIQDKRGCVMEPLDELTRKIIENDIYENKADVIDALFDDIRRKIQDLIHADKMVYLIIDDVSHLLDLGVDVSSIVGFTSSCYSLTNSGQCAVVINTHVCTDTDQIIANCLQYVADVFVEVAPLKTGRSSDVTGVLTVERASGKSHYQYKSFDRGVKTFHPGEAIHHMYK